jgi:hypothetical protein
MALHDLTFLADAVPVEIVDAPALRAAVPYLLWSSNDGNHRADRGQSLMGDNAPSYAKNDKSSSRNCDHHSAPLLASMSHGAQLPATSISQPSPKGGRSS